MRTRVAIPDDGSWGTGAVWLRYEWNGSGAVYCAATWEVGNGPEDGILWS